MDDLNELSMEILRNTVSRLTLNLRFMDIALNRYRFAADSPFFSCDGTYFHYAPAAVIRMFRNNPNELNRGYFHIVLHSVFRHVFFGKDRKISLWNLACDIAVEDVILSLDLECLRLENDDEKRKQIERLKKDIPDFTAQKIYHRLEDMETDRIRLLTPLFAFDDHECWYEIRKVTGTGETLFGEENRDTPGKDGNNRFDKASHDTGERKDGDSEADESETELIRNRLKNWQDISDHIEEQLKLYAENHGDTGEVILQSLKKLHREKYSYSQFLQRFMRTGEKMQINDEDFDTIFYTYGLQLYQNLPLIEPLESKEIKNVRELIIAIDTSGSVQGDTVQAFLQKTWNLFEERENFFSRFNIHILQCDMMIREAAVIRSSRQFEYYIKNLQLKGFAGTDFRPVFQYADEQIREKKFRKLGGVIYFTDGDGVYPKTKPDYPAAFLFLKGNKDITVPPWAVKYILEEDELYAYSESENTD